MRQQTGLTILAVATATVAALSLGPSFAHVLEAPPRLSVWSPELWREATVFNGQFALFATVGAPLDVAAILLPALFAYMNRDDRGAFRLSVAAAVAYAASLAIWFLRVAPANAVLATWVPGPVPADFDAIRWRWESGHMMVATVKLIGFVLLICAIAGRRERPLAR